MTDVLRYFLDDQEQSERVLGVYLLPYCTFIGDVSEARIRSDDLLFTAVAFTAISSYGELIVTRNGGIFIHIPACFPYPSDDSATNEIDTVYKKLDFERRASYGFNELVCELALEGIVSDPASPVHSSLGQLKEGYAAILGGTGGREYYPERNAKRLMETGGTTILFERRVDISVLKSACSLAGSKKLTEISKELPFLVANAFSSHSRYNLSGAISDSWIVVEQILDSWWSSYLADISDSSRRDRLKDSRVYTAATRTELLYVDGQITTEVYDALNKARSNRNKLAHRAQLGDEAARECMETLRIILEKTCNRKVEPSEANFGVNW